MAVSFSAGRRWAWTSSMPAAWAMGAAEAAMSPVRRMGWTWRALSWAMASAAEGRSSSVAKKTAWGMSLRRR